MKNKCICIYAAAVMLLCANGLTALAYESPDDSAEPAGITETWKGKQEISDKEKDELEAKHKELADKWGSLSKEQKEEIYKLHDKAFAARGEILDKLAEFGLIGTDDAAEMKNAISKRAADMREKGLFPGSKIKRDK